MHPPHDSIAPEIKEIGSLDLAAVLRWLNTSERGSYRDHADGLCRRPLVAVFTFRNSPGIGALTLGLLATACGNDIDVCCADPRDEDLVSPAFRPELSAWACECLRQGGVGVTRMLLLTGS